MWKSGLVETEGGHFLLTMWWWWWWWWWWCWQCIISISWKTLYHGVNLCQNKISATTFSHLFCFIPAIHVSKSSWSFGFRICFTILGLGSCKKEHELNQNFLIIILLIVTVFVCEPYIVTSVTVSSAVFAAAIFCFVLSILAWSWLISFCRSFPSDNS